MVPGRQRQACNNQHWVIYPGAWQVMDKTCSTERSCQGQPMSQAFGSHPSPFTWINGMATAAFLWPSDLVEVLEWSPHSPDINLLDAYLYGYRKEPLYGKNPRLYLKATINAAERVIPRKECHRGIKQLACQIQLYLQHWEAHLENILEYQWNKEFLLYRL
jgi:hypothetical protein